MPTLRLIGPGRAGLSLAQALGDVGWRVAGVLGRADAIEHAADGVDLLVLATPDDAIAAVASSIPPGGAAVAHMAGALGLDVLAPHDRRAAIHPLVSLPNPEIGAARLASGAWFAVAGEPIARDVVAALGGRAFEVSDDQRGAYHAAACIAANHVVALLGQAERVAASAGVSLEVYLDLVRDTVDNVARLGPARAITGPAARGDTATILRHIEAIDAGERPVYTLLAEEARALAARK